MSESFIRTIKEDDSKLAPTNWSNISFTDTSSIEVFDIDGKDFYKVIPHKGRKTAFELKGGKYYSEDITLQNLKSKLKYAKENGLISSAKRLALSKIDAKKVMNGTW